MDLKLKQTKYKTGTWWYEYDRSNIRWLTKLSSTMLHFFTILTNRSDLALPYHQTCLINFCMHRTPHNILSQTIKHILLSNIPNSIQQSFVLYLDPFIAPLFHSAQLRIFSIVKTLITEVSQMWYQKLLCDLKFILHFNYDFNCTISEDSFVPFFLFSFVFKR